MVSEWSAHGRLALCAGHHVQKKITVVKDWQKMATHFIGWSEIIGHMSGY